jgi:hypothetical protein
MHRTTSWSSRGKSIPPFRCGGWRIKTSNTSRRRLKYARLEDARRSSHRAALSIGNVVIGVSYWPSEEDVPVVLPGVHVPIWPARQVWRVSTPEGESIRALVSSGLPTDRPLGGGNSEGDYASELLGELIVVTRRLAARLDDHRFWNDSVLEGIRSRDDDVS